jgi:hypothetical protein
MLLSFTALIYPTSFSGVTFLAVGYNAPAPFDLESVNALLK